MARKRDEAAAPAGKPPANGDAPGRPSGNKPPVHEIRLGRLRAVVWENSHATQGVWYSVILSRSFKDNDGNWRAAHSFGRDDLLVVAELARQAFLWVAQHGGNTAPAPVANGTAEDIPV